MFVFQFMNSDRLVLGGAGADSMVAVVMSEIASSFEFVPVFRVLVTVWVVVPAA